ncbi:MAG TPA: M90 family metallopeptidase [Chitinophagales bacterium]|nr:M90 family metallopeptidase [Chitinophagales bacterium]
MDTIGLVSIMLILFGVIVLVLLYANRTKRLQQKIAAPFPQAWRNTLQARVLFYTKLNADYKKLFEKRVQFFIATKSIEGVETEVDDVIRLMVASSAVIPTFAFPKYNYPNVHTVLIYPNSFNEKYQTQRFDGSKENITGMVSGRQQNGTVILSKPDLVQAFDGLPHKSNVGIHEFVHLLDKEDGDIDGIPEILLQHRFVAPWLHEIQIEIRRIEKGKSDIDAYAVTSKAEFLAVVSEYFFDNPEKFYKRHPELYKWLSEIFNQSGTTTQGH